MAATHERYTLAEVREQTYKKRDAWWTVLLVDPIAAPLVVVTANRTSITPNQLTSAAMVLGVAAAGCFWIASPWWLVAGALLFHLSFVLDCMDGKIARLKGTGSAFGAWLDFLFDRIRELLCALALFGGQFRVTGHAAYLWVALIFVSVNAFRYINSAQLAKIRQSMAEQLATSPEPAQRIEAEATLHRGFVQRFRRYVRVRDFLMRHRIRTSLVSGIEYQNLTFVVAPILQAFWVGALLWMVAVTSVLLLAFETGVIYTFWLSTRAHRALVHEDHS